MSKTCQKCPATESPKWYTGPLCKRCYFTIWRSKNRDKTRAHAAKYAKNNAAQISKLNKQYRELHDARLKANKRVWFQENKTRILADANQRYKDDLNYKIAKNLRSRLYGALKNNSKAGSAVDDLGCSIEALKSHLEAQWQPGMSWDNHTTDGWHIDHIVPLDSFDLTDPIQFKKACHYSNLQPLWWLANLKKSNK